MLPSAEAVAVVGAVVFVGGFVTGVTGFGYAIFATATLASLIDPQTAVVIVIIPILAANVSLVRELDRSGLRSCARRFWPFVGAGAVGTLVGMVALSGVSPEPLSMGLGLFTLGYVALSQPWITLPGEERFAAFCLGESYAKKGLLGLLSGVIFGATNAGVQVIAYLKGFDLDHSTFVGVVAMIFLGVGLIRVLTAWLLGLYPSPEILVLSVVGAVPGLVGVSTGKLLRPRISPRQRDTTVFALLAVIGVNLVANGVSGLL